MILFFNIITYGRLSFLSLLHTDQYFIWRNIISSLSHIYNISLISIDNGASQVSSQQNNNTTISYCQYCLVMPYWYLIDFQSFRYCITFWLLFDAHFSVTTQYMLYTMPWCYDDYFWYIDGHFIVLKLLEANFACLMMGHHYRHIE